MNATANEAEALATKAIARGSFTLTDMLQDRTFPEIEVPLYLDEAGALKMLDLTSEIVRQEQKMSDAATIGRDVDYDEAADEVERLISEVAAIRAGMEDTKYVATVRGISNADRKLVVDEVMAEFPTEYEVGERSPFSGKVDKTEIPNPDRDAYFLSRMWAKYIIRLTAPDGATMDGITQEDAAQLRFMLPTVTLAHLEAALEKVQVASDWYEGLTNEVF